MAKFKIGNRYVGDNYPPLVIAEIGINHNGNLDLAIKLVDSAIRSGAEIIKHQTHIPEEEMSEEAKKIKPGNSKKNIYSIINKCSLSESDEKKLFDYVKKKKKIFISSPFSLKAAKRLANFGVPAFKIGSGEVNNFHFVEYICKFKKPIILSTGMNSIASIKKTVSIIRKYGIPFALLHCTNLYPTPFKYVRLDCITELKKNFGDAVVGLSDHTTSINTCLGAVALGASILERHYIDDRKIRKGPDIKCSMNEKELRQLIVGANEIYLSRGGNKKAIDNEKVTIDFAFASVASKEKIFKGQKLTKKNIELKRPGTGDYGVNDFNKILGKVVKKDIKKNVQINKKDLFR
tara:strand:+ start:25111 stop:26154 length:1044 start_codon:yes stop_codon:yes gene_type:complete